VWAHALELHAMAEDNKACLWAGCVVRVKHSQLLAGHEAVHTGVWPNGCPTCEKGHQNANKARKCCVVLATCRCGATFNGASAKKNFTTHQKRCCSAGAAPLPAAPAVD